MITSIDSQQIFEYRNIHRPKNHDCRTQIGVITVLEIRSKLEKNG